MPMTERTYAETLAAHSRRVILEHQQPSGAYLAGPLMPDYQFSWFRDGAYIAYALLLDGDNGGQHNFSMAPQWESAMRFHNWCADRILERADALERAIAAARSGAMPDGR